jgi:uncharacterized protein YdeI (YjbR/CyaY-like superfamily)
MPTKNPQVDAYIAKSAPFARPILTHLRRLVHAARPGLSEEVKWGMPFFVTEHGPLCHFAAFKAHCAFGFWRGRGMKSAGVFSGPGEEGAMGGLGRITSLADLGPDEQLTAWVQEAAALAEAGVTAAQGRQQKEARPAPKAPADLAKALRASPEAKAQWVAFSPSKQREYVTWLEEAKTEATREKRLATALEQIAEGKSRQWKYEAKMKAPAKKKPAAKKAK